MQRARVEDFQDGRTQRTAPWVDGNCPNAGDTEVVGQTQGKDADVGSSRAVREDDRPPRHVEYEVLRPLAPGRNHVKERGDAVGTRWVSRPFVAESRDEPVDGCRCSAL